MIIGEVDVPLPAMPDEKDFKNYDKKTLEQKFQPQQLPDFKRFNPTQLDEFAKQQWERRLSGEWWLIKGQPFYIPGPALVFFDFWTTHRGKRPEFRIEALEFFLFWYLYVEPDPNLYGMYDLKCRRLGDTEKIMFIVWERTTRYRGVNAGIQSYTDDEAKKNFGRLAKGNRNMPYFFRPKHSGTDTESLNFQSPAQIMTMKRLKETAKSVHNEDADTGDFLNSYIDYEATATGKYDGQQLFTYSLDEVFKIPPHMMDVKAQWQNIKKVQSLHNDEVIFGKSIFSSTVEEKTKDASKKQIDTTVDVAEYFWDNSDPNDRDEYDRTYTGLARLFRGYELAAKTDEWGFHKVEQARAFRESKLRKFREKGDFGEITNLYRKEPASPEEALSQSSEKCPLHPELCYARLNQIKNGLNRWDEYMNLPVRVIEGELEWENGIPNTKVKFTPRRGGKWHISQMPLIPNNVGTRLMNVRGDSGLIEQQMLPVPLNMSLYRMGCDPYDADVVIGKGSDGAFTVKRLLNMMHESGLDVDDLGEVVNVEDMITNTYILDYKYRHKNPYNFYMDVVKTCWFFGVGVFPETDKPGLSVWMRNNGYGGFLQYEPPQLVAATARRKAQQGAKATSQVIATYVEKLQMYISKFIWNNHHPRLLTQWARFIPAQRTKFDLAVSSGFTEIAEYDTRHLVSKTNEWTHELSQYQ